jgi:hypothetical protein
MPSSQYIRCQNCEAEWTSRDFIGIKDLATLKLWNPPEVSEIYAEFVSQSPLKLRKSYPIGVWLASMKGEKIELPAKASWLDQTLLEDTISAHKKGVMLCLISVILILGSPSLFSFNQNIAYCAISLGASLIFAIMGYYRFTVTKENAYILFCGLFVTMFIGLIALPKIF